MPGCKYYPGHLKQKQIHLAISRFKFIFAARKFDFSANYWGDQIRFI
jgi:hypothetical protein